MKKFILVVAVAGFALSTHADLRWGNSGAISNFYNLSGGAALAADQSQSSVGCFAQLIYAGLNGSADLFTTSGNGVTGDDVVVDTMFAGQDDFDATAGIFPTRAAEFFPDNSTRNGDYYVRVYNAPNLDFAGLGTNAPVPGGATYYFQSEEHTYAYDVQFGFPDNFDFAPDGGRTTLPIPEPAALGLGVIGLISLRLFSSKRKS